jgi:2-methylcitrate dehydratase PrpD
VEDVSIETSPGTLALLSSGVPRSGVQGRFSMSYAIAAALVDRRIGLSTFTDKAVRRPQIRELMNRITASERSGDMIPRFATIIISLRGGNIVSHRVDTLHGSPTSPLSDTEFLEKIEDCLSWANSPISAGSVLKATSEIEEGDVPALVTKLMAPIHSRRVSDGSVV